MGRKRTPGLYKRKDLWHIDKQIHGRRLCESTGTFDLAEAEQYLARRIEQIRQAKVYGVRPKRIFREAATKFLLENQHKASIGDDAGHLKVLDEHIGDLTLEAVHIGTLQSFISARKKDGVKMRTINHGLQVVRHILNLAAGVWLDEHGLTWLQVAPKIKLLPEPDARKPFPLNWEEQTQFFQELPLHLRHMALFAVNTGCRDREVCLLKWEWEVSVPEIPNCSVFLIPGKVVKNRDDRLVVLNSIAKSVIEEVRGTHPEYVFTYKGKPVDRMLRSAWRKARVRAELPHMRVHDLKHTFGRRLRAAGVSFEDRQDLLGHKSGRITTHYSAAELSQLIEAVNKVCVQQNGPALSVIRGFYEVNSGANSLMKNDSSRKSPAGICVMRGDVAVTH